MKVKEIEGIVDAAPRERAALFLEMGAELGEKPGKALKPGTVPASLKRESVTQEVIGPVLAQMHGLKGFAVTETRGLKETGMKLKTPAGVVPDLTLNQFSRKEVASEALNREKDRSVKDLMVRQLAVGMMDSSPIARISAAYGYWQATGAGDVVAPVLANGTRSDDDEEQMLAAHSLVHVDQRMVRHLHGTAADDKPQTPIQPVKKSMTVIVHGTFAMKSEWYKPGGEFHSYIKKNVFSDTYSGTDFYFWSGRYSLNDKTLKGIWKQAATKLVSWCKAHPAKTLRLITHSHGANVVNLATQMGLPACSLIQLSVPVRNWNLPVMSQISSNTLFNVHSTVDLVVKVDGGAQDYRGTEVASSEKRKIIAIFGHSASHDAKKWAKKEIPKLVKSVCP